MKALRNLILKYYRKLSATYFARYYNDIATMPIGYFNKCMNGDLSHVAKTKYYSEAKARLIWADLFNQHLKAHGLPESYVIYIDKMVKALEFYNQAYHGKKWQVVRGRVHEAEAKTLLTNEGEKIETTCARISKYMGFPVRANECSVVEFHNYVKLIGSS